MADDGDVTRLVSLSRSGIGLCLVAGIAFAAQPIVLDSVLDNASPLPLLAWRYLLAGAVMIAAAHRGVRRLGLRATLAALVLGAVLFALDSMLFYASLGLIPVPLAGLIHYLHLPFVVGAAVLVTGRRASRRQIVAVALVVAGVALVSGGAGNVSVVGVGLALGSAAAYALYMLLSARLLAGAEPIPAAAVMLTGAGVSLLGAALIKGIAFDVHGIAGTAAIVESAIVGSVLAVGAFYVGLQRLGPARTPILLAIDVPVGIALAALVLGERLGPVQLAGAALVVAAIAALQLPTPRQRRARRARAAAVLRARPAEQGV
jgi:drug/metabolite transporter (DMT)-like permease